MSEEKEFYSIGRGSLNLNGKFYYGLDYAITDFMRSLEHGNKELKKQLEDTNEELELVRCDLHNRTSERDGYYREIEILENQQKEFIDWLEKTIEKLECDDVDDEDLKGYLLQRIDTFKEILQKYKEINHIAEVDKMVGGKE